MNPFDGVSPNISVLGVDFNSKWQHLLAVVLGLAFVFLAFKAIMAWVAVAKARKDSRVHDYGEALGDVKMWGVSLAGVAALPLMFGAINMLFF